MISICENAPAAMRFVDLRLVERYQSDLQLIEYFHSEVFGRILVINGEVQHVEEWAAFYHEILVHLPCAFIPEVRSALVLGGGDLFVAAELLKYQSLQRVHVVDFDYAVIELTAKVRDGARQTLEDPRLSITVEAAEEYLTHCGYHYDIVVNDAIDLAYANRIGNRDLFAEIQGLLTENGICSDLIYRSIYDTERFAPALVAAKEQKNCIASLVCVPEYPGIFHILTMWGNNAYVMREAKESVNVEQFGLSTRGALMHFDPQNIPYYLYIPPFIRKFIK